MKTLFLSYLHYISSHALTFGNAFTFCGGWGGGSTFQMIQKHLKLSKLILFNNEKFK